MCKALGSIPSTARKRKRKRERETFPQMTSQKKIGNEEG
jgi:hypothetical protein